MWSVFVESIKTDPPRTTRRQREQERVGSCSADLAKILGRPARMLGRFAKILGRLARMLGRLAKMLGSMDTFSCGAASI